MLIDITLKLTSQMEEEVQANRNRALLGHLGTHFDVMNKVFPLAYTRREGIVFDVAAVGEGEIQCGDIDLSLVKAGMFVSFYTNYIERCGYGSKGYFSNHPQLSHELIDALLSKCVSIIGIDSAGIRRGKEHTPADQRCADANCFVIENLCGLGEVLAQGGRFIAHTYPMRYEGLTGLPCRVIAEV